VPDVEPLRFSPRCRGEGCGIDHPTEKIMLSDTRSGIYESHWMRHADRYLALVRAALAKDPDDLELLELLQAMQRR
jgi:hypothetical protein